MGAPLPPSVAAERAHMSKDQQVTAVRVANVPAAEFDAANEGKHVPTVTALAGGHAFPRGHPTNRLLGLPGMRVG